LCPVCASFNYDVLGRRTQKTVSTQSSALSTAFLYDGNDIAAEIGGGAVGANYLRSLNIDEPFIRQAGTGNEFYHTDALGSAVALSTAQGAPATTYGYEPFGKTTVTGSSSNAFQFTGREQDGTGLYYYRARYYYPGKHRFFGEDPRFIDEDPLGFVDQSQINLYVYANQNPVSLVDPLGLWSVSVSAFAPPGLWGPGFSFTSGQNPNGSGFVSLQLGYGSGGGVKFDPFGQQPGYDPSRGTSWGLGLGAYAQGDFNAGYIYAGAGTNAGINITSSGVDPYTKGPSWRAGGRGAISGINATAHGGVQITLFGGGKLKKCQ